MSDQLPPQCVPFQSQVSQLNSDIAELQAELHTVAGTMKAAITAQIKKAQAALIKAESDLAHCKASNQGPTVSTPPPATMPAISNDQTLVSLQKVIQWSALQKKIDEFINKRTDPPIFKLRFNNHPYIIPGDIVSYSDQPASDVTISMLEAAVQPDKTLGTAYNPITTLDLGQLDDGFYFQDINSTGISVTIDPHASEPITIKITFETGGPTEAPTTSHILKNIDFIDFYIQFKMTFTWQPNTGIDFFAWIDSLNGLKDDALDKAITKYVIVHIVSSSAFDFGGAMQKGMRGKLVDNIRKQRTILNNTIRPWILGGNGSYAVSSFVNDGTKITINYKVPQRKLEPFPNIRPAGWPYLNNPKPDPQFDFSLPSNLSNIKHIVVLTMENRSFDHMLGYLSLPVASGGRGRTDVDGLKGGEFNFYNGKNVASFAFAAGDTIVSPDPSHSYGPVFHQLNYNTAKQAQMNGFVKSFAEEAGGGDGARIMGFQPQQNVPVYDALVHDFAFSHRWFAAHPGPTFANRFFELTGRLNLSNGFRADPTKPIPAGFVGENTWEFSNSSPLTPVFTKSIFDYLTDYAQRIEKSVTWKYYEHGYCFLRFFSKYTFDTANIVTIDDPVNGFFTDCQRGTLPSVSYIDPHFIELPPNANCDGPVADIRAGQSLVQKIVEAVVTSPAYPNTLLVILYDEHGGFYDHVPPPQAPKFSPESPIETYGVRVPAFFISPWVKPGAVFGHDKDASGKTLYFDSTSILKTIARRFMTKDPPYMGKRYEQANDLTAILEASPRKNVFMPFIRYNFMYLASKKMLDLQYANIAMGTPFWQWDKNGTPAQDFSIEEVGDFVYIRNHVTNSYLTVDASSNAPAGPGVTFGVKQDVKYEGGKALTDPVKYNPKLQLWKLQASGITVLQRGQYIIWNAAFATKLLQPVNNTQSGALVVLADKAPGITPTQVWNVSSPNIPGSVNTGLGGGGGLTNAQF